jgi:DNA invertase Pin-like site-specific DNA recombinase
MAKYGCARVSTREQNPDSRHDALTAAGIAEQNIMIAKISGELASSPKLDRLPAKLERRDVIVVTRLRRIGQEELSRSVDQLFRCLISS